MSVTYLQLPFGETIFTKEQMELIRYNNNIVQKDALFTTLGGLSTRFMV